jgi:hypothetical protein
MHHFWQVAKIMCRTLFPADRRACNRSLRFVIRERDCEACLGTKQLQTSRAMFDPYTVDNVLSKRLAINELRRH